MARKSGGRSYGLLAMMMLIMSWNSAQAMGKYVVEEKKLVVTSPGYIKGKYDCAVGNFGIPRHAGTIMGSVAYSEENHMGCQEFDSSFKSYPGGLPTIVLVDRGDCYLALKVWNAQKAGAAAVLVSDDIKEPLITMDFPEDDAYIDYVVQRLSIPSALIEKNLGDKLKKAISKGDMVNINFSWRDFVPQIDRRVKYEFWMNDNHDWGLTSEMQMEFLKNFKGVAQILEKNGHTQFTPHYITWQCPQAFTLSKQCKAQCINHGRYCALDFEHQFSWGFAGKDVVIENLRQLCVFQVAKEDNRPWVWWDYVTDFNTRCNSIGGKYIRALADSIIKSLSLDSKRIEKCMGDPNADTENPILEAEQAVQVGHGSRNAVTIVPTLFINDRQYRGRLDTGNVLKAICSGYKETFEPTICLNDDMKTDESCKDTSMGRVCKCPLVEGVQLQGDDYTYCEVRDVSHSRAREFILGAGDKKCRSSVPLDSSVILDSSESLNSSVMLD
ncbi:hypothetical protein SUGI_0598250 [Cryptomeria japonica]|nr:hypothetical protein SUGI_0598250 [Cryptomeria japonica]